MCQGGGADDIVQCTVVKECITCTVLKIVDDVCYDRHGLSKDVHVSRETSVLNDDANIVCGGNNVGHSIR